MNSNLIHQSVALQNIYIELSNQGKLLKMGENGETFTALGHSVVHK